MKESEKNKVLYTIDHSMQIGCLIWLAPLLGLMAWAFWTDKILIVIIGVIFTILIVKNIYDSYHRTKRLKLVLKEFDKVYIFLYPTRKSIQDEIKEKVGNHLNPIIKQIYYDGPSLVGDIQNKIIISGCLAPINKYGSNHPRLIQIQGNSFIELISLKRLIKVQDLSSEEITLLIEEINSHM